MSAIRQAGRSPIEEHLNKNREAGAAQKSRADGGSVALSGSFSGPSSLPNEPDEISEIELGFDEQAVNDRVIQALATGGDLYDFNGALATVCQDSVDQSRRVIRRLPMPTVREWIASRVRFVSHERDAKGFPRKVCHRVPKWSYEAIFKRGRWDGVPAIRGIVTCPVLRADGSILQESGFDPNSGLFLDLSERFPAIPERPSAKQASQAVETLFDVVTDFPFANCASRSAWLASVLTPLAREAHSGCTGPMFLVDANVRGSGKTLLADIASLIVTGREAVRLTAPRDDEEFRKRITALVNDSERMILVDNIAGKFGCESIDSALTGTTWKDRRLGYTEMVEAPLRMTWFASGNNVLLKADTARRTCHIRLESPEENPEDRQGFKHADIRAHVRLIRPALLSAALTILRGFIAAGRPNQELKPWGSFESWSDIVRGSIVWAGLEDPGNTRTELRNTSDSEAGALRQMILALSQIDPEGHGLRTSDLLKIASGKDQSFSSCDVDLVREAIEVFSECGIERINNRKLGSRLGHFRSRVVDGLALDCKIRNGTTYWTVRSSSGSVAQGGSFFPGPQVRKDESIDSSSSQPKCEPAEKDHLRSTDPPSDSEADLLEGVDL
jgi:hypothetical protein